MRQWTGQTWGVSVSMKAAAGPTLRDVKEQKQAEATAQAAEDPLVKAILETFPGATVRVTQREDQGAPQTETDVPDTAYEDAFTQEREDE